MGEPFIRLKLNTKAPIELGDFVGAFTALASEYERNARLQHPETEPYARLFVKEVRSGSVEALVIPVVMGALPTLMQNANELADFVRNYGAVLTGYLQPPTADDRSTEPQLRNYLDQVAAIANEPGSSLEASALMVENSETKVLATFKFDTRQARSIRRNVEARRAQITETTAAPFKRVVMTFTRSDTGKASIGKRSGERVRIDAIAAGRSVSLVYASEMAEAQIKHEINEADDNVFKKAFLVDVIADFRDGRPITYSVAHVHSIVDIDDE